MASHQAGTEQGKIEFKSSPPARILPGILLGGKTTDSKPRVIVRKSRMSAEAVVHDQGADARVPLSSPEPQWTDLLSLTYFPDSQFPFPAFEEVQEIIGYTRLPSATPRTGELAAKSGMGRGRMAKAPIRRLSFEGSFLFSALLGHRH